MDYKQLFAIYMDRAFTAAALEQELVGEWSFDEWFSSAGDIERVYRAIEIAGSLVKKLEAEACNKPGHALLGDVPVTDFCYSTLETELKDFILQVASEEGEAPSDEGIIAFVMERLAVLAKTWTKLISNGRPWSA